MSEKEKGKANAELLKICELSGWDEKKVIEEKNAAGVKYKVFLQYEFWNKTPAEREGIKRRLETKKIQRENRYSEMSQSEGIPVEELKPMVLDAKEKYGLSLLDFKLNNFWLVPEEKREEEAKKIFEGKAERKKEREKANKLAEMRKTFITSFAGKGSKQNDNRYPAPVRVACYCLGHPLPEDATMDKSPSEYIGEIDASLDSLRAILGEVIVPDNKETTKRYSKLKKLFSDYVPMKYTETDFAVIFTDFMLFGQDYGYEVSDYLEYMLFWKDIPERNLFASEGFRVFIRRACNINVGICKNKVLFNEYMSNVIKRGWMFVTAEKRDEFESFIEKHDRFFSKPISGGGGVGAGIITVKEWDKEDLFNYCVENGCIVEEVLKQHEKMNSMFDGVVNTVRIGTMIKQDGTCDIIAAFVKFGRSGLVADNLAQGGIGCAVDKETGIISSDAIDYHGIRYAAHPDTGVVFKGFQIPCWDNVVNTAIAGAEELKKWNRHIGWDIAIMADGRADIIEGNSLQSMAPMQIGDQIGKRPIYDSYLKEIAAGINMPYYDNDIPVDTIDVLTEKDRQKVDVLLAELKAYKCE